MAVHEYLETGLAVYTNIILGIDAHAGHLAQNVKDVGAAGLGVFSNVIGKFGTVALHEFLALHDDKIVKLGKILISHRIIDSSLAVLNRLCKRGCGDSRRFRSKSI